MTALTGNTDKRSLYLARKAALELERSTWLSDYKDITRFLAPRQGRYTYTDTNKGNSRINSIYDNTGTRAKRVLQAGLMAGMTSPARPWFRLTLADKELAKQPKVRAWLDSVADTMRLIFNKSNTYRALHQMYGELGPFGTAAAMIKPNFDNVIHLLPLTVGEYSIATNGDGKVVTLAREVAQTVSQLVTEFGPQNCSDNVRNMYDTGRNLDSWVPVCQIIEPRTDRNITYADNKNMPFASCYFELNGSHDYTLRESGFKRFPGLVGRWDVQGADVYGQGPGHESIGDVKQLQQQQFNKGQAIDLQTRPPLQAPGSLKTAGVNKLPGGVTYYDNATGGPLIKPLWDVNINLEHLREDIVDVRNRINESFYVPLFLTIINDERNQRATAREIAEKHEEKLLMIGPVLERLHDEVLAQLIDITFDYMTEAKIVPPAPPELQGQGLNVEFVSMLAQAQRAVGVNAVDRLVGTIGSISQLQIQAGQPASAMDKLNVDEIVDQYNDMLGGDPRFINDDDTVKQIRDQRAQQMAAAQAAANQPAAAQTAKTLSETNTTDKNGLTDLIDQFSGYTLPQGAQK